MKAAQFDQIVKDLGMTQKGAAAFLGISERTVKRFVAGEEIWPVVAMAMAMIAEYRITPEHAYKLAGLKLPPEPPRPPRQEARRDRFGRLNDKEES